jgi:glycosyltransferase involved in cell wall biosynthesis
MSRISLCISTIDERLIKAIELASSQENVFERIIVHQVSNDADYSHIYHQHPGIRFETMQGKGLSKSRNKALEVASGDWIYLCDDDLELPPDWINHIDESGKTYPEADIFVFQIKTPDGSLFKEYPNKPFKVLAKNAGSISSAEMIIRRNNPAIRFNEAFGIGSLFISGEEYLMVLDALASGKTIQYIPKVIAIHPAESTGSIFNKETIESKGAIISHLHGWKSIYLNLGYAIKKSDKYKEQISFWNYLKYIYAGSRRYQKYKHG